MIYNLQNKRYTRLIIVSLIAIAILLFSLSSGVAAYDDTVQEEDSKIVSIELDENGDAYWVIELKKVLEDETDKESFEDWIDELENNDEYRNNQVDRFNSVVYITESHVNRDMSVTELNVEAHISESGNIGITQVKFTWTNFAQINNNEMIVGDVFQDGYNLDTNEKLKIHWDSDKLDIVDRQYTLESISEEHNSILWAGPGEFDNDEPEITFNIKDTSSTDTNYTDDNAIGFGVFVTFIAFISILLFSYRRVN